MPTNTQIIEMLIKCDHSKAQAAINLNISRSKLYDSLKKMSISAKDTDKRMMEKAKTSSNTNQLYLDFILAGQKI